MQYLLPANNLYGDTPIPLEIPDKWNVQICSYKGEKAPALTREQMEAKISNPEGCLSIREKAKGCKDAVIIVEDVSRPTPINTIAHILIDQLTEAGVPRDKIRFVFALGSHRAMYYEDFVRKLGKDIVHEFPVYNHNAFYSNVLVGRTSTGVPIELNAECVWADFKIGIGTYFPHPATGMGGGGKLICPGIASIETIRRFHMLKFSRWTTGTASLETTLEAANMLGLDLKIDAILNGKAEIADLLVGDCRSIIYNHFEEAKEFFETPKAEPVDVLLVNNYFKPSEPSVPMSLTGLEKLVKPGGTLILAYNSPQGCAPHYCLGQWGETGIGGVLYGAQGSPPPHVGKYIVFAEHPDHGAGRGYVPKGDNVFHADTWEKVLALLDDDVQTAAIYPYGCVPYFKEA